VTSPAECALRLFFTKTNHLDGLDAMDLEIWPDPPGGTREELIGELLSQLSSLDGFQAKLLDEPDKKEYNTKYNTYRNGHIWHTHVRFYSDVQPFRQYLTGIPIKKLTHHQANKHTKEKKRKRRRKK
jgi:hypothetical protein